ncbi:hypothetical protein IMG5_173300 [Ichthyophthirius multifiliis]|uniref:Uncharacterized protein n=1 Tax=Ichthyophthirius multifiliis TaxID=5932 RepID=G0R1W7_ICHMU|nr:hypothetical protein IMG5_173300 [Ichthyophthirius multifiliis]EGR28540.1 hypothetical protein IMG5_173300 [Ichthyophthirius multifiliis]|eukprot:XP_004029776.1 hypothetical protein IMG5_173300 [Ichthyophthirius multifiliis]
MFIPFGFLIIFIYKYFQIIKIHVLLDLFGFVNFIFIKIQRNHEEVEKTKTLSELNRQEYIKLLCLHFAGNLPNPNILNGIGLSNTMLNITGVVFLLGLNQGFGSLSARAFSAGKYDLMYNYLSKKKNINNTSLGF